MHCPRCGQEQISASTKFCSRCGFLLEIVAELLANGGALPQLAQMQAKATIFNKKNGVFFSVFWFVLFTLFLTSVAGILDLRDIPGLTAVTGVFGSILILIYSLVFLPSSKPTAFANRFAAQPHVLHGTADKPQLPPEQFQPASVYTAPQGSWRVPDTGELVTPGTVTEDTTKLLRKDELK